MKPTDLTCYKQIADVIGEALADYELQRIIDFEECHYRPAWDLAGGILSDAFDWGKSPQISNFWGHIDRGENPYDHGHEKPEIKEWLFINGEWHGELQTSPRGDILATHKSVTMPDWIPEKDNEFLLHTDRFITKEELGKYIDRIKVPANSDKASKSDKFKELRKTMDSEAAYRAVWGDPESEDKPAEKLMADKYNHYVKTKEFAEYAQEKVRALLDSDDKERSDGSTASYYELPECAAELQHLISHRNMNAQIGEIFRACYRYGLVSHSDMLRDAKKIKFYAQAEIERLEKLAQSDK